MAWQVQEAKQKFSEFVRKAVEEGPQVVTRHGTDVAVLLSAATYRKLSGESDFKKFLLTAPGLDELEITRSRELTRQVEL